MFVAKEMPRSVSAEAYRSIKTSINYSSADKVIKTIVVTSSIPAEGKSTIAGNLTFVLSENNHKVLLIDCDLRKPSLHKKFGVSSRNGITDLLIGDCKLEEGIKSINENIDLITSGTLPPNPVEIVGSNAFKEFIDKMSLSYDYIVIDTAPVLAVTDAQLLSVKCDGTLLVVRANKTRNNMLKRSYEELKKVGANLIGTILNDSESKGKYGYYKY